jgi:tRNA dimethylallyltransferase
LSTESKNKTPIVLLFGPTAVGKTSLLDQIFDSSFEVINADSQQVYRYLDIGTAKPPEALLHRIPHHLIGILDPSRQFDVGTFVKKADILVGEIRRRGHMPVISGGTAFYFYHFIFGIPPSPPSDKKTRKRLKDRLQIEGERGLWEELQRIDPESAERIHPRDTQRLLRALEVFETTGRPLSSFRLPTEQRPGLKLLLLGLNRPREELYRRIDERVDQIWEAGLPEEIRGLLAQGCGEADPGMKGIGYREFFQMRRSGELLFPHVKEEIKKNSRRYAKRQLTFFRRIPGVEWFHPDQSESIRARILAFMYGTLKAEGF